jgi:hypothetical protein
MLITLPPVSNYTNNNELLLLLQLLARQLLGTIVVGCNMRSIPLVKGKGSDYLVQCVPILRVIALAEKESERERESNAWPFPRLKTP